MTVELVDRVMPHGYSGGTLSRVTSSAEKRLYPDDQTYSHRFLLTLTKICFLKVGIQQHHPTQDP